MKLDRLASSPYAPPRLGPGCLRNGPPAGDLFKGVIGLARSWLTPCQRPGGTGAVRVN